MSDAVTIIEVGPRDGLQNEAEVVATETKVELVNRLARTGLTHVEATAFVSPAAIPQLADASDVMAAIDVPDNVTTPVLVPNMRGYEAARAAGATSVAVFTAASESFNERNINASIAESIERFKPICDAASTDGVHVRGYVSMAFGCPYEGIIEPSAVGQVVARLADLGIADVSLGDTIGVASPRQVPAVLNEVTAYLDIGEVGLHMHDTRGTALACCWTGYEAGVRTFDASVAGLGGCPFADGATGNLATEDLVWMLHRAGVDTGVDIAAMIDVAQWISGELSRPVASRVAAAPVWPPA